MPTKQVIIIRRDLKMRRGKEIAQGAHASLGAVFSNSQVMKVDGLVFKAIPLSENLAEWFNDRFTKITVKCNSEDELLELAEKAKDANLQHFLCKDAGLTEFGGVPTYTALAIGPAENDEINKITGDLVLL